MKTNNVLELVQLYHKKPSDCLHSLHALTGLTRDEIKGALLRYGLDDTEKTENMGMSEFITATSQCAEYINNHPSIK